MHANLTTGDAASDAAAGRPPEALWEQITTPAERQRLLRYCLRLSGGNRDVAEDMAQETLAEAWRKRDALRNADAWRAYLYGIAQNVHRRWWRHAARESAHRLHLTAASDEEGENRLESLPDPRLAPLDAGLEQAEVAHLLGRALHRLTPTTRHVLVSHYVDDVPHAEIAARMGLTESSAAVRVHRAKQALREALTTTDLRAEAVAFGLVTDREAAEAWLETRVWCPMCGRRQMLARRAFESGAVTGMHCPGCQYSVGPHPNADYFSACFFKHHAFRPENVTGGVTAFKPALNRLHAWWYDYLRDGVRRGRIRCLGCGRDALLLPTAPTAEEYAYPTRNWLGVHAHCLRCGKVHVLPPSGFAVAAPPVVAFWKKHGRMRVLPVRRLPDHPRPGAFLARVESIGDGSRLEVVFAGDDFSVLETHGDAAAKY